MSFTMLQLRQELAKSLDSLVQATATAGSTTTLTDLVDLARYPDDHFIGADLYITDTTDDLAPKGEVRYISDSVQSTGVLTVDAVFTATVGAGDTADVYLRYSKAELDQALTLAVSDWRFITSLSLSSLTAEYALTGTGLHAANQVAGVFIRSTASPDEAWQPIWYRAWDTNGTITLELDTAQIDSSYSCRVEYRAQYVTPTDTAVTGGDLWRHILRAQSFIYRAKMQSAPAPDFDHWAGLYREAMERLQTEPAPRDKARKARLQDWGRRDKKQPTWDNPWL